MFKKYNSIENTFRGEFLNRIKTHGFWENDYVVQEKVHGSNLSFWTNDGKMFYSAKRTEIIKEQEKFYNSHLVLSEIKPKLIAIWKLLKIENSKIEQMTIFGELFGGDYPHKKVDVDKQAFIVQKGIFYSPKNHFYAFDIMINAEKYLDVDMANKYFTEVGLLHAKTLFKGNIKECLAFSNDFNTTIPSELHLPILEPNRAEGVVIKPIKVSHFNNGVRVMLKNKNEKWSENKKYHKSIIKTDEPSGKVKKLQEIISTFVTENRLNNVLSKIGQISKKDFGRVLGLLNKDIVDDFTKDYYISINELDKNELKQIKKSIGKSSAELVNKKIKET